MCWGWLKCVWCVFISLRAITVDEFFSRWLCTRFNYLLYIYYGSQIAYSAEVVLYSTTAIITSGTSIVCFIRVGVHFWVFNQNVRIAYTGRVHQIRNCKYNTITVQIGSSYVVVHIQFVGWTHHTPHMHTHAHLCFLARHNLGREFVHESIHTSKMSFCAVSHQHTR